VLDRREVSVSREQMLGGLDRFRGDILQVPPMYAAIKHQGRPLYDYARKGQHVERAARAVHIGAIELREFDRTEALIAITCSKGTYVRVIAEDLGEMLGCGAHLSGLVRIGVGPFSLDQARTPEQLSAMDDEARVTLLLRVDVLLQGCPSVMLPEPLAIRFGQGVTVQCEHAHQGKTRVYGPGNAFLGLGTAEPASMLKPRRLLRTG